MYVHKQCFFNKTSIICIICFKISESGVYFEDDIAITLEHFQALIQISVEQINSFCCVFKNSHQFVPTLGGKWYSQNHVKCSRPLCSLPGLQGPKTFADVIINFLIPCKSISDKNSYDQLFINEVVKFFTFQFDESVIKFYLVKVLYQILMKFW